MDKKKNKMVSDKTSILLYGIFFLFLAMGFFFLSMESYSGLLFGFFGVIMLVFSIAYLIAWLKYDAIETFDKKLEKELQNRPTPEEEFRTGVNQDKDILGKLPREYVEKTLVALNRTGANMGWKSNEYTDRLSKAVIASNELLKENTFGEITYEQKKYIDELLADFDHWAKVVVPIKLQVLYEIATDSSRNFSNLSTADKLMVPNKKEIELRNAREQTNNDIDREVSAFIRRIENIIKYH